MHIRTLNICFKNPKSWARRFAAFTRETLAQQPDVVCIQEGIWELKQYLAPLLEQYDLSPYDPEMPYFTLILVRKELGARFERVILPSSMQRGLQLAHLNNGMVVATTHLESMDNARIRRMQLTWIARELEKYPKVVLAGDFNFCSYRNFRDLAGPLENDALGQVLPDFKDSWGVELGAGYTNGKYRLDRIMCKGVSASAVRLVYQGVSDHKGIRALLN